MIGKLLTINILKKTICRRKTLRLYHHLSRNKGFYAFKHKQTNAAKTINCYFLELSASPQPID